MELCGRGSRGTQRVSLPHQGEADLKGGGVVLEVDDEGEEQRGDEVGQGDDDGGQVLIDEVHHEVLLWDRQTEQLSDKPSPLNLTFVICFRHKLSYSSM